MAAAASTLTATAPAATAYAPSPVLAPTWLNKGDNAWQLTAASLVGLQSVPGLVILYGGIVKKKWAINSAFMAMYAFAAVMIVWVLWAYNMAVAAQCFGSPAILGVPKPVLGADVLLSQASIPSIATTGDSAGLPPFGF